jgi:hypothetical protein
MEEKINHQKQANSDMLKELKFLKQQQKSNS